jgi:DeoR/GlpR family transcriptional regulator of sugar metabolism
MKTLMADRADDVILLADFTKFVTTGLYPNVSIDKINTIITDSNADPNLLDQYREKGIEVIMAQM